jgi:hypothetical protein
MEPEKLVARSLGQHFDAAIVIIPHPSGNAELVRFALDEPAKSDALHASANKKTFSLEWFVGRVHISRFQSFKLDRPISMLKL